MEPSMEKYEEEKNRKMHKILSLAAAGFHFTFLNIYKKVCITHIKETQAHFAFYWVSLKQFSSKLQYSLEREQRKEWEHEGEREKKSDHEHASKS